VHGVRSLALEARLPCTGTVERIERLRAMDRLPPDLGADLIDALHVLMGLKLEAGLQAQEGDGPGHGSGNGRLVNVESLSSLQRALLKDALEVVKRFKGLLRHRYHLEML
jgi:CBS domain-containing protein